MLETGIVAPSNSGSSTNGFIASIGAAFNQGLQKIGSEILPNWTAKQLGLQQTPLLDNPTYNSAQAPPMAGGSTTAEITPTLWDRVTKTTQISSGAVIMVGVVLIGAAFALKIFRGK